jgi:hypothetical protein
MRIATKSMLFLYFLVNSFIERFMAFAGKPREHDADFMAPLQADAAVRSEPVPRSTGEDKCLPEGDAVRSSKKGRFDSIGAAFLLSCSSRWSSASNGGHARPTLHDGHHP